MHVLLAPDSYKGSLDAADAAEAMRRGLLRARPNAEVLCCPIADGGEGTAATLAAATGGVTRRVSVTGPLPSQRVDAAWVALPDGTAVIEMAQAAGLGLVPEAERDTRRCSTFGVGELVRHALDAGSTRLLLTLGGSATTDGGTGCAQALGAVFESADGTRHGPDDKPLTGGDLGILQQVDLTRMDPRLAGLDLGIACDVTNPLSGPNGAAHVYAPQKGADPAAVDQLDAGLRRLANAAGDPGTSPGDGAAGGMGFAGRVFLGGELRPGIDLVLEAVRFEALARGVDLVVTGEGQLDGQSLQGKAVLGVAHAAKRVSPACRVVALVGATTEALIQSPPPPLDEVRLMAPGVPPADSIRNAAAYLEAAAAQLTAGPFGSPATTCGWR